MNFNLAVKMIFAGLMISALFGCQSQTVSNSSNNANSTLPGTNANGANNANQSKVETSAPRDVKFESEDMVEIVGTFYESAKANSPAVLLLHQFGSNRKSFDEFAKRLQAKNFGVLAIDGRGFGESVKTTDGKTVGAQRTAEGVKGMEADVGNAFDFF